MLRNVRKPSSVNIVESQSLYDIGKFWFEIAIGRGTQVFVTSLNYGIVSGFLLILLLGRLAF